MEKIIQLFEEETYLYCDICKEKIESSNTLGEIFIIVDKDRNKIVDVQVNCGKDSCKYDINNNSANREVRKKNIIIMLNPYVFMYNLLDIIYLLNTGLTFEPKVYNKFEKYIGWCCQFALRNVISQKEKEEGINYMIKALKTIKTKQTESE